MMNPSFGQLHAFREVMRSGSISEAARLLGRTQPAVSAAIAKLEEELGFSLFDRQRARLIARPEAHYFLEEVEEILTRLTQTQRLMSEIGDLRRGELRVACLPAAADRLMPAFLSEFIMDKPGVSASLMMRSSMVVADWIASQQYDVGLAETPPPRASVERQVFDLTAVCALPTDHILIREPTITPEQLDGLPLAMLYPAHPVTTATEGAFHQSGARLNQRFELQTFMPALELVRRGLCVCVCDPLTATSEDLRPPATPGVVFRPFRPAVPFSVAILTPAHRPQSTLTQGFVEALSAKLQGIQNMTDDVDRRPDQSMRDK